MEIVGLNLLVTSRSIMVFALASLFVSIKVNMEAAASLDWACTGSLSLQNLARCHSVYTFIASLFIYTGCGSTKLCVCKLFRTLYQYSAKRHNITVHGNAGEIVPLVEYLICRSSGRYQTTHRRRAIKDQPPSDVLPYPDRTFQSQSTSTTDDEETATLSQETILKIEELSLRVG